MASTSSSTSPCSPSHAGLLCRWRVGPNFRERSLVLLRNMKLKVRQWLNSSAWELLICWGVLFSFVPKSHVDSGLDYPSLSPSSSLSKPSESSRQTNRPIFFCSLLPGQQKTAVAPHCTLGFLQFRLSPPVGFTRPIPAIAAPSPSETGPSKSLTREMGPGDKVKQMLSY